MKRTSMLLAAAAVFVLSAVAVSPATAAPYTNHTVGGNVGWKFDEKANKTLTDYHAWAAKLTFSLGDFLIFETNGNSTVIQTSNLTAYTVCDVDAEGNVFDGKDGVAESLEVPLTVEGDNYFYSGAFDGQQCQKGMRFKINVLHGNGLPPSLKEPPPSPPPSLPQAPPQVPSSPSSQQETFYRASAGRPSPGFVVAAVVGLAVVVGILR